MTPKTSYIMVKGSESALTDELAAEMTRKFGYPPEYTVQIGRQSHVTPVIMLLDL